MTTNQSQTYLVEITQYGPTYGPQGYIGIGCVGSVSGSLTAVNLRSQAWLHGNKITIKSLDGHQAEVDEIIRKSKL